MSKLIICLLISVVPVLVFLAVLRQLDRFRLIKPAAIFTSIGVGCLAAGSSFAINRVFLETLTLDMRYFAFYSAPLIEEFCKALYVIFLIRSHRVGFRVDSAMHGFAIGAGFAGVENIYYLLALADPNPLLWFIRGFGTAMMHSATTVIVAIMAKTNADRRASTHAMIFVPGLVTAMVVHSFFNHFFLSPLLSTVVLMTTLPLLLFAVFQQSEHATRKWLDVNFDTDVTLYHMITAKQPLTGNSGEYLSMLREKFPQEVANDIFNYLRIYLQLSIKAKGLLLMREAGVPAPFQPDAPVMLEALESLKTRIGTTGQLAIAPLLSMKHQELWQLRALMTLQDEAGTGSRRGWRRSQRPTAVCRRDSQ